MQLKYLKAMIFCIAFTSSAVNAISQINDTIEIQRNERGKVQFARFMPNTNSNWKMQNDTLILAQPFFGSPDYQEFYFTKSK